MYYVILLYITSELIYITNEWESIASVDGISGKETTRKKSPISKLSFFTIYIVLLNAPSQIIGNRARVTNELQTTECPL